jgi:hypothetical protein
VVLAPASLPWLLLVLGAFVAWSLVSWPSSVGMPSRLMPQWKLLPDTLRNFN